MIFSPLLEGGTTHQAVMVIRLLILSLVSVYLGIGVRDGVLAWPALSIGPPTATFLGLAAVSTVSSPYMHQSVQWLVVLLSYAGLLYLIVFFAVRWDHVVKPLAVLTGMGLFEAALALVQAWLGAARPSGTFFNPNFLAGYLTAIWSLVLGSLCYGSPACVSREGSQRFLRILSLATLGLLLPAMVWTGSRGGMLALGVSTTLVGAIRFGRRGLAVLLLLLVAGLLLPNPLRDRWQAEHVLNPLGYARWQIWQASAREMVEHPLGTGLGLYQYVYPRSAVPVEGQIARYGKVAQTAHNEYLQMGVEIGVASILVFGWGIILVARDVARLLRQRLWRWQRGVVVGLCGGIAGILAHAAVDSNLHEPALAIVLTLYVGLVLAMQRMSSRVVEPPGSVPIRPRWMWAGLGTVVIGLLAVDVLKAGFGWMAYEAGKLAAARQDYARAIGEYRSALALDPGKALYHSSLAAVHFQVFERTGDHAAAQAAIAELQAGIALNPLDGRLLGLLGLVYASVSSPLPASKTLAEPSTEQRRTWLHAAVWAYERAAVLEPFNPFHHFELGRLHVALGDRERAEASIRRAIEIEPNFLPGREWLVKRYLESGRREAAHREYQEILERQRRYAGWTKDALDERFLKADVSALEAELQRARARA